MSSSGYLFEWKVRKFIIIVITKKKLIQVLSHYSKLKGFSLIEQIAHKSLTNRSHLPTPKLILTNRSVVPESFSHSHWNPNSPISLLFVNCSSFSRLNEVSRLFYLRLNEVSCRYGEFWSFVFCFRSTVQQPVSLPSWSCCVSHRFRFTGILCKPSSFCIFWGDRDLPHRHKNSKTA
jgi:hypothetical protein